MHADTDCMMSVSVFSIYTSKSTSQAKTTQVHVQTG